MRAAALCILCAVTFACGEVDQVPVQAASSSSSSSGAAGCAAGRADCDGDGTCETALGTADDCGACGDACASLGGTATCQSGHCVLACDPGFADCNGRADDGCEAELASDARNCGACGASCGDWGDCFQQSCVEILATAQAALVGADDLLVQGSDLYWDTPAIDLHGEVATVPIDGGIVAPLATGFQWPSGLRSNGAWLVWSDNQLHGLYRMALPAGAAETIWTGTSSVMLLDVDADDAYFTTGADVQRVPIAGGSPVVIASGFVDVSAAHLAGGALFVTDAGPTLQQVDPAGHDYQGWPEGTLAEVSLQSGKVSTLAQHLDTPVFVRATADALYWVEAGSLATYVNGDAGINVGTLGRVMRASLDGSSPVVIADQLVQPRQLALDASHVYWVDAGTVGGVHPENVLYESDGDVRRAPVSGGPAEIVLPAIDARSLALSSDAVFIASWNYGFVLKKSKP